MRLAYYLSLSSSTFLLGKYHGGTAPQYFGIPWGRHCVQNYARRYTSLLEASSLLCKSDFCSCGGDNDYQLYTVALFARFNEAKGRRLFLRILSSYYRFFNFDDIISNNISTLT